MKDTLLAVLLGFTLLSCQAEDAREQEPSADSVRVAVLLAPSGKGDRSYNDMVLTGLQGVESIQTTELLPSSPTAYESAIDRVIEGGVDLVVAVGFTYVDAVASASQRHGTSKFLVLDGDVADKPNVRSIVFQPDEGSALVGAIAGLTSRTGEVAFLGGMDIPIINVFRCGYEYGVQRASERSGREVVVRTRYVGTTPDAFSNPAKGREIARGMLASGADVIYAVAGASGNGAIAEAAAQGVYAIGVDTDQSHLAPAAVLTSMRKRLDIAVQRAVEDVRNGSFTGGTRVMNLENLGVDYVSSELLPDSVIQFADSLANEIKASGGVSQCKAN